MNELDDLDLEMIAGGKQPRKAGGARPAQLWPVRPQPANPFAPAGMRLVLATPARSSGSCPGGICGN